MGARINGNGEPVGYGNAIPENKGSARLRGISRDTSPRPGSLGRRCVMIVVPFGMLPGAFLTAESVQLDLAAPSRELALEAMVSLLQLRERSRMTLLRLLARRELLGSTAVGRGVAIPHCRSLVVPRVRMAYGRLLEPLPWDSIDGEPVQHIFLIVAPPVEVSNQYLPTLGQLARAARQPEFRAALEAAASGEAVAQLLRGRIEA
jgi:PTS system nitrogen regulatory IIA component